MDVVGESHKVACLVVILEFGGSAGVCIWFAFQFSVSISLDLISHHLDFSHTCNRVRSLVDFVDGIVACTEQREAVIFQSQDINSLESVDDFRVVDGMFGKTITCDIGTAEALGVGEVTVTEDTTLAVVFIEFIIHDAFQIWNFVALIILHRFIDEAIGVFVLALIIVISVIIAIEVGAVRKIDFLHVLLGDGDMLTALAVAYQNQGVSSKAGCGSTRK